MCYFSLQCRGLIYWFWQLERWNCGFESHLYVAYMLSAFFRSKELSRYAMLAPRRRGRMVLSILDLGTRWLLVVSFTLRPRFTSGTDPGMHWIRDCVGIRAGLDTEAKRKIIFLSRRSNPSRRGCCQTVYWLSYTSYQVSKRIHNF
jgi:hypothetical protein